MWGRTETSRPDTADVPALGFGYLAVRNHVPHALLSGRATRMGMWVLQGRCSLTRAPQDFNGSQEVPPCRADAEGEAAASPSHKAALTGAWAWTPPQAWALPSLPLSSSRSSSHSSPKSAQFPGNRDNGPEMERLQG